MPPIAQPVVVSNTSAPVTPEGDKPINPTGTTETPAPAPVAAAAPAPADTYGIKLTLPYVGLAGTVTNHFNAGGSVGLIAGVQIPTKDLNVRVEGRVITEGAAGSNPNNSASGIGAGGGVVFDTLPSVQALQKERNPVFGFGLGVHAMRTWETRSYSDGKTTKQQDTNSLSFSGSPQVVLGYKNFRAAVGPVAAIRTTDESSRLSDSGEVKRRSEIDAGAFADITLSF